MHVNFLLRSPYGEATVCRSVGRENASVAAAASSGDKPTIAKESGNGYVRVLNPGVIG